MKTVKILTTSIISVFLMTSLAFAQQVTKMAYMDLSKVFDNYEKTKEYDAGLEAQHKEYVKERDAKIQKLKDMQQKMDLLKEEEKGKMQKDMEQVRNELMEFDQQKGSDIKKQRDEKIREILLEVEKVVSDFAKKEQYDIILNDRVLIYGSETMDVSDQVLKILNESYNKKAAPAAK